MSRLIDGISIERAITVTAGAAGTSAIEGAIHDMQGFDEILFIVNLGAIVSGAVTSLKVRQGAASDLSDAADLLGTSVSVADTDDEKIKYIYVRAPLERYVQLYASRATQNATMTAVAIKSRARSEPTSQGSNVAGEAHNSPIEGTA